MKKMMLAIAVCLGFALMGCQKNSDALGLLSASSARAGGAERCKGKPKPNCPCTDVFAPVCGCDGVTYSNSCEATCAGVLSYTPGSCEGPYERKR
jgi:Kazal-type serine protease inhibitor domain